MESSLFKMQMGYTSLTNIAFYGPPLGYFNIEIQELGKIQSSRLPWSDDGIDCDDDIIICAPIDEPVLMAKKQFLAYVQNRLTDFRNGKGPIKFEDKFRKYEANMMADIETKPKEESA